MKTRQSQTEHYIPFSISYVCIFRNSSLLNCAYFEFLIVCRHRNAHTYTRAVTHNNVLLTYEVLPLTVMIMLVYCLCERVEKTVIEREEHVKYTYEYSRNYLILLFQHYPLYYLCAWRSEYKETRQCLSQYNKYTII